MARRSVWRIILAALFGILVAAPAGPAAAQNSAPVPRFGVRDLVYRSPTVSPQSPNVPYDTTIEVLGTLSYIRNRYTLNDGAYSLGLNAYSAADQMFKLVGRRVLVSGMIREGLGTVLSLNVTGIREVAADGSPDEAPQDKPAQDPLSDQKSVPATIAEILAKPVDYWVATTRGVLGKDDDGGYYLEQNGKRLTLVDPDGQLGAQPAGKSLSVTGKVDVDFDRGAVLTVRGVRP